jgi:hypothetical protein
MCAARDDSGSDLDSDVEEFIRSDEEPESDVEPESDEELDSERRHATITIRAFIEQGAKLDDQDRELWARYLKRHPEFKKYADYPIAVDLTNTHNNNNYGSFRALNDNDLDNRYPVVITKNSKGPDDNALSAPHGLDLVIFDPLAIGIRLQSRFLFNNKASREKAIKRTFRNRSEDRLFYPDKIKIYKESLPEETHEGAGLVFFLEDEDLARKITDHLNQAERFRELLSEFLPDATIKYSIPAIKRGQSVYWDHWVNWPTEEGNFLPNYHEDDEIEGRIFATEDPGIESRFTLKYTIIVNILDLIDREYKSIKNITKNVIEQKPNKVLVHVTTRIIRPILPEVNEAAYQKNFQDSVFQSAIKYGDFKFKFREGELRADSSRLRVFCPLIKRLLTTKVGSDTVRDSYNVSRYSKRALEIFIRGIYEQDIVDLLTPQSLPELYDLFFEMQCQYEPLGLQLNKYLGIHLQTFEDPLDFITSIYEQTNNDPELSLFNEQIRRLFNDLSGKSTPTESDYQAYARYILNQIRDDLGSDDLNPFLEVNIAVEIMRLKAQYIGIKRPKDSYFKTIIKEGGQRLEQVVREEAVFPLEKVQITYPSPGRIEYTLIPRFGN